MDEKLPKDATVLVVSKGDEELLKLGDRTAWHFPRTPSGVYAGHHPADGPSAIQHLEELRGMGAEYLVFPSTASWWLNYYVTFRQHLNTHYRRIWEGEHCIIYQLSGTGPKPIAAQAAGQGQKQASAPIPALAAAPRSTQAPDPIIIYGPPRSGTSYLNHILNRHPDISITPETRIFVWAHRTLKEETQEFFSVFKHRDRFISYLQGKYPDLIREYYRELDPNARYWGDKNPHYASADSDGCLQTILDLFPGTKFINIIRDGRGNITSVMKKGWADFEKAHRTWVGHLDTGRAFGRSLSGNQYFELRYEDLIEDDTAMARRIFDFLEIEIHPNVVTFCDNQKVKRAPINQPERDLSGDLTQSDWSAYLTREQQLRSLDLLGDHLIEHGYETEASLAVIRESLLNGRHREPIKSVGQVVRDVLPVGRNGFRRRKD